MKRLILTFLVLVFFSCEQSSGVQEIENNADLNNLKVVVIDGCEYLQYHVYYYEAITHKGNCKNHKQWYDYFYYF